MISIMLAPRLAEKKWTQADLARKTGIRPTTISELYHELVYRISLEQLELICEALDCDVCDILTRQGEWVAQAEKLARRTVQMEDVAS